MNQHFANTTLGDIVAQNYLAAAIFERHGLDFCCGGRVSLAEGCREKGLDVAIVEAQLARLSATTPDVSSENLDELVSHIESEHHAYVRAAIPSIDRHLAKVVVAHGARHPELFRISSHFENLARDLTLHLAKEEQVLFPYIRALAAASTAHATPPPDVFGTVQNPIRMMEIEHQEAGDEMATIRSLACGYQPPDDACATYRLVYTELQAFERDLHRHVHLENNVLFPRAIRVEAELTPASRIGCGSTR